MDAEDNDKYISQLMILVEGMVPLYEDAKIAQEELLGKNIAYRMLSSIPWRLLV